MGHLPRLMRSCLSRLLLALRRARRPRPPPRTDTVPFSHAEGMRTLRQAICRHPYILQHHRRSRADKLPEDTLFELAKALGLDALAIFNAGAFAPKWRARGFRGVRHGSMRQPA